MQSVFDFQGGEQIGASKNPQEYITFYYHSHFTLMFYVWILADIPILLGLFGKFFGISYKVHSFLMTVVTTITFIAITLQFVEARVLADKSTRTTATELIQRLMMEGFSFKNMMNFLTSHVILARILFVLVALQALGGYVLERLYEVKTSIASFCKKYARLTHMTLGLIIWVAAKVQLYKKQGLFKLYPWISFTMVRVSLFGLPALAILLKLLLSMAILRKPKKINEEKELKITETQKNIVKMMKAGASKYQLSKDFPRKKVFVYEHNIYDLSSYLHPGGSFFYEQHNWEDITLLMNGNKADERTGLRNKHSAVAYAVLSYNLIGTLKKESKRDGQSNNEDEASLEVQSEDGEASLEVQSEDGEVCLNLYIDCSCSIKGSFDINNNYQSVSLSAESSDFVDPYFNFGKYFFLEGSRIALYGVQALSPERSDQRRTLMNFIGIGEDGGLTNEDDIFSMQISSNNSLTVIIDKENKKVKKLLRKLNEASSLHITGAFGRGLPIWNGFKARLTLIAEDSGCLPLIDLLDLIFIKQVVEHLKERDRLDVAEKLEKAHRGVLRLSDRARFRFFGDFKTRESCLCFDLLKDLHQLSEDANPTYFRAEISLGNGSDSREEFVRSSKIDKNFLEWNVIDDDQPGDLVLLSGSQSFYYQITKSLEELGYPKGRLLYL